MLRGRLVPASRPLPNASVPPTFHGAGRDAAVVYPCEVLGHPLPQAIMSTMKILFFAADPLSAGGERQRLLLDKEAREIKREVVAALHRDSVDFETCWATRLEDLRQGLLRERPQIVHFSGHGGSKGLVLESADGRETHRVGEAALEEFFAAFRDKIRVVVLNACHSGPQAKAIARAVGCAIGTPAGIADAAAIIFSAAFYSSIAYGNSVQTAFDQACATLRMEGFADHEDPELIVRPGVDASKVVLVQPEVPAPPQPPSRRLAKSLVAATVVAVSCGALYLGLRPDPACAPAREVQRAVMAAGTPATARMGLLSPPDPNDPMAGPRELVEAKRLHRAGNHAADFPLFKKAAEAGNTEAMISVGLAYLHGEGITEHDSSGLAWLRKAADKGDPQAMTELGEAYLDREGGDRDYDYLARHWFQRAADERYPEAMRNLGHLYRTGRGLGQGVGPDGVRALDWYAKAAKAGFLDAMVDAGNMYEQGQGVPRNMRQAMCWYRAAEKVGAPRGKVALGIVDDSLGPEDDRDE